MRNLLDSIVALGGAALLISSAAVGAKADRTNPADVGIEDAFTKVGSVLRQPNSSKLDDLHSQLPKASLTVIVPGQSSNAALAINSFNPGHTVGGGKRFTIPAVPHPGIAAALPEPATLLLLGTGLIGIASRIRRRKRVRKLR